MEGNIVKNFVYSKDFKEDMINFKSNNLTFSKSNVKAINENYITS